MILLSFLELILYYGVATFFRSKSISILGIVLVVANLLILSFLRINSLSEEFLFFSFIPHLFVSFFDFDYFISFSGIMIILYLFIGQHVANNSENVSEVLAILRAAWIAKVAFLVRGLIPYFLIIEVLRYFYYDHLIRENIENKEACFFEVFKSAFFSFSFLAFSLFVLNDLSLEKLISFPIYGLKEWSTELYFPFLLYFLVVSGWSSFSKKNQRESLKTTGHTLIYFISVLMPLIKILFCLDFYSLALDQLYHPALFFLFFVILIQLLTFASSNVFKLKFFSIFKVFALLLIVARFFVLNDQLIENLFNVLFLGFLMISSFQDLKKEGDASSRERQVFFWSILLLILNSFWFPGAKGFFFFFDLLDQLVSVNFFVFAFFLMTYLFVVVFTVLFLKGATKESFDCYKKLKFSNYLFFLVFVLANFLIIR